MPASKLTNMRDVTDGPEHRLSLRQADQARNDFAAILDELDFLKEQADPRLRQSDGANGDGQLVGSDRCRRVDAGAMRGARRRTASHRRCPDRS